MPTFLERYRGGDYVAVWDDLVALGEGVRHELYYADAVAVATETMRRARHNVELLIQRLADVGYRFIPPADEYAPDLGEGLDQRDGVARWLAHSAEYGRVPRLSHILRDVSFERYRQELWFRKLLDGIFDSGLVSAHE